MACSPKRFEEIGDLAAGRLGPLEAQDLLEHLEGCGACSEELDLVADLVAATAEPAVRPSVSPRARFLRPGLAALAAAAAILAAAGIWRLVPGWVGGWGPRPAREERIAALAVLDPIPAIEHVPRSAPAPEEGKGGKASAAASRFREAMARYSAGDFAAAGAALGEIAREDPSFLLARLYLGVCRLRTGKPRDAVAPLTAVVRSGEGLLRERALWYLANAHLRLGEGARAADLLQRLEGMGGDYELNARDLLARLREILEE